LPTQNALASVQLDYVQKASGSPYQVTLRVWNRSFDHPDPTHRSAIIKGVFLTQLPGTPNSVSNLRILDRYGIDETGFWAGGGGFKEAGFDGYIEGDSARLGKCQPDIGIMWNAFSGIYDERCLADSACDAMRLQTIASPQLRVTVLNYLLGPVTFSFDFATSSPPKAVRLVMALIGGNGGNPAQRWAALPEEEFVIQFP
jgi:hypothetical protein